MITSETELHINSSSAAHHTPPPPLTWPWLKILTTCPVPLYVILWLGLLYKIVINYWPGWWGSRTVSTPVGSGGPVRCTPARAPGCSGSAPLRMRRKILILKAIQIRQEPSLQVSLYTSIKLPRLFAFVFFVYIFLCRPLLRLCRPFMIFEGCLDSNPEYCCSKLARYRLSHPSLYILHLNLTLFPLKHWTIY